MASTYLTRTPSSTTNQKTFTISVWIKKPSPTTYNFTLRATDAEGQTADRSFSFTSTFGASGGGQFN